MMGMRWSNFHRILEQTKDAVAILGLQYVRYNLSKSLWRECDVVDSH
jgi:hypothetical protein